MDGQTSEEICKELNMPASNLRVLLYRARLRLAKWSGCQGQPRNRRICLLAKRQC